MPSFLATIGLNSSSFHSGLSSIESHSARAGKKIVSGLAGFAAANFGTHAVKGIVDWGSHLVDLSERLGISTDAIQEFDHALKLNGGSIDALAPFFQKLARSRDEAMRGNEKAIDGFKRLGVSIDNLKSKRLEDLTLQIGDAFKAGDPQQLIGALTAVGGRGAGEFVAAMRDGLREAADAAHKLGIVLDAEVARRLDDMADRATTFGAQLKTAFAPVVDIGLRLVQGLWRGLNVAMRGVVGFATGGVAGSNELVEKYEQDIEDEERALKDLHEKKRSRKPAGPDLEETNDRANRAAERSAEKILRLKDELFRKQAESEFRSLSHEQQILELLRRRAEIYRAGMATRDEAGRLQAGIDIEDIDQRLAGLRGKKPATIDPARGGMGFPLSTEQSHGLFGVGMGAHNPVLSEARTTNQILREIKQALVKPNYVRSSRRGVNFGGVR